MGIPLLGLIGFTSLAWLAVFVFGTTVDQVAATLAMLITLPPAVMTFVTIVAVSRRWPDSGPAVVLGGTLVRMLVAVVTVAVLGPYATEFRTNPDALRLWTTCFYLLTLALETGLLWRVLTRPHEANRAPSTGSDRL